MSAEFIVWCQRQAELSRLRWEAVQLCNELCRMLTWPLPLERRIRIELILSRARNRLARRRAIVVRLP